MKAIATAVLLLALASAAASAQNTAAGSTASGVFTLEQAKAGERSYQAHCASCHGLDLRKTDPEAPDLTDSPFRFGWQGKTIGERFEKIRSTMPKPAARSLDDQTYLDIVTYILHFNGLPAGSEKL